LNYGKLFKWDSINLFMRIKKISEVIGNRVYTDSGDFFGEIEEANLSDNKVDGWRIKVGGSVVSLVGGAKGVIIPHQFVKAVGDVFLINRAALPNPDSNIEEIPEDML
jgi:sporulation protein YlmC with PRC-barrel domain